MAKQILDGLVIYTDGGSRGNPGPAAIGVVFTDAKGTILKQFGKSIGRKTNNEAEYEAVLVALQKARALYGKDQIRRMKVEMRMDSQLVCRQLTGEYKIEEERLWPLFMEIWNIRRDYGTISFTHVPREKNRGADRMVNEALDNEQGSLL
jgi:ribonuclease HI